jgi:hypothetical protein
MRINETVYRIGGVGVAEGGDIVRDEARTAEVARTAHIGKGAGAVVEIRRLCERASDGGVWSAGECRAEQHRRESLLHRR